MLENRLLTSTERKPPAPVGVEPGRGGGLERSNLIDLEEARARWLPPPEPYVEVVGTEVVLHCRRDMKLTPAEALEWARSLIRAAHAARENGGAR